ncbi:DNA gyrase subunit A [Algiphilus sp.]|uniref:DNA gyrase subunit A n=1 Tax=Algiphilus sp. TaxID=1872431 RepID=UPI003B51CAF6
MTEFAKEVLSINLEEEMQRSYLDYAMSVIVGRALPDARDGLKPVHRRVLYAMKVLGNDYNKPYKKSARVVGDVIGKYHPHGDSAVYDTIVRMAQSFSMRYLLVDGQGNFGSVDGDAPAAMRYTEVRMSRLAHEMLADIDRETVDFVPNYDESETEPAVLPARIPQLLVNGAAGIAVGMATNIPPHNLSEVIDGCVALIDDPELDLAGLMQHIPAPDFPTAGLILDANGLADAYASGRGRIVLRARTDIEDIGPDRQALIVNELPYQVNKARLLERIAELVKDKKVTGISEIRDESDKEGMRMVIELKRSENAEVVLNHLFQHTQLQTVFGINMVALNEGQPRTFGLKELLEIFLRHRREVVTRRTRYLLRKARERAHGLEGLTVALANIDEVIACIRRAATPADAKAELLSRVWLPGQVVGMLERAGADASKPDGLASGLGLQADGYHLSEAQVQAILDMRLQRLTALEQDKIIEEYSQILEAIGEYLEILGSDARLLEVIREELLEVKEQFGDARRTEISNDAVYINREDLVVPQDMVVTLSHEGYVKSQPLTEYQSQRRGGRGRMAAGTKNEDFIDRLWVAHSHDTLLCFSSAGKVYRLRVFELPEGSRGARGRPFVNLLPLETDERISAVLAVQSFDQGGSVFMATRRGTVKKTPLAAFSNIRSNGIIAVDLRADDALVGVTLTSGNDDILLISSTGRAIRFNEGDVRSMGRGATGVRGMRLIGDEGSPDSASDGHARVIALLQADGGDILTVSEYGFGKRTAVADFPLRGRGGQGVIAQRLTEKSGELIGAIQVQDDHEVMLVSHAGNLIRVSASEIRTLGRNTQGVRIVRPVAGDRLMGVDRVAPEDGEEEDSDPSVPNRAPLHRPTHPHPNK